ncbi:MAG: hypothetical protein HRU20_17365 [Pseudomonadales bacterium]|nr:hypothetical protein [Pseudomonadales bacterium]
MIKMASPIMALWLLYSIYIGGDMVAMIALMAVMSPILILQLMQRGWFNNKKTSGFIRQCF